MAKKLVERLRVATFLNPLNALFQEAADALESAETAIAVGKTYVEKVEARAEAAERALEAEAAERHRVDDDRILAGDMYDAAVRQRDLYRRCLESIADSRPPLAANEQELRTHIAAICGEAIKALNGDGA